MCLYLFKILELDGIPLSRSHLVRCVRKETTDSETFSSDGSLDFYTGTLDSRLIL